MSVLVQYFFFFFKQKTAYEMVSDWSSDVCSSDLVHELAEAIASGGSKQAIGNAPPQARGQISEAANQAFVAGFNTILLVGVAIAVVGAISALVLVRQRDFVAVGAPEGAPAGA